MEKLMSFHLAAALDSIASAKVIHEQMTDGEKKNAMVETLSEAFEHIENQIAEILVITVALSYELPHVGFGIAGISGMPVPKRNGRVKSEANKRAN